MTADDALESVVLRTYRYRGLLAPVVFLVSLGIALGSVPLVLAAVIPLGFLVVEAVSNGGPIEDRVAVQRSVSPEVPLPGQRVEIELTVTNTSETAIADLRVLDGVPQELGVETGAARGGRALAPGDALTLAYSVIADRGRYRFRDVVLESRTATGAVVSRAAVTAEGDDRFDCRVSAEEVPLQEETTALTGPLATDTGGPGIEFYATREYRSGDPVKRINWRRYAKTGELSTVEYREQRATRVAVIVDGREAAQVSPGPALPTGATLGAYAATIAVGILLNDGHRVDVGALGVEDPVRGTPPAWAGAETGRAFRRRAAEICNLAAAGRDESHVSPVRADGGAAAFDEEWHWLNARLGAGSQVLFCSPCLDEAVHDAVETFLGAGHPTTVLSPDVLPDTVGGRVLALERAGRLDRLRSLGATVVDWHRDEPLPIAMGRTLRAGGP